MLFQNLTGKNDIGANSYRLQLDGVEIVLDAGVDPKVDGTDSLPRFSHLPEGGLDAIFITHSHLDHMGALPVLMEQQPQAEVYLSPATALLTEAMLHNSVNVMTHKRAELGLQEYPFFTHRAVDHIAEQWSPRKLEKTYSIGESAVTFRFYDAGHIMGAVGISLFGEGKKIFYTGDVHFEDQSVALAADFPEEPLDVLIVETTRGNYERPAHYTREAEAWRLAAAITETIERGGSVLIPVFALGKTQELLILLDQLTREGRIPKAPLFIGGLSTKVTRLYDKFRHLAPRQAPQFEILQDMDITVASRRRKRDLHYEPGCIYALSSGMMTENTVSNRFAKNILHDPKNSLLFVGYADPDSPAGKIRAAQPGAPVALDPKEKPIALNCPVHAFDFSGHATRESILAYIQKVSPRDILLVHGEEEALTWFEQKIGEILPHSTIHIPEPGKEIAL